MSAIRTTNSTSARSSRWLPVVGYEDKYIVCEDGRVMGLRNRTVLTPHPGKDGYLRLSLYGLDGIRRTIRLHRIVLAAFVGPRPVGMEARHEDGDKANCTLSNLSWGTSSENKADQVSHGTHSNAIKTHCKRHHEFTPENTYITTAGSRQCRRCIQEARGVA